MKKKEKKELAEMYAKEDMLNGLSDDERAAFTKELGKEVAEGINEVMGDLMALLELENAERKEKGLAPLTLSELLETLPKDEADEIRNFMLRMKKLLDGEQMDPAFRTN